MKVQYASLSLKGNRPDNEDAIRIEEKDQEFLFALADGLGSYGNGRIASDLSVDAACSCFLSMSNDIPQQAIYAAQDAVLERQKKEPDLAAMSSTLAVLYIRQGTAQWAHIGDSRVYHFSNGKLAEFTKDHSVPQMLVNLGQISQDEVRGHPDQNRLLKVVGRPWTGKAFTVSDERILQDQDQFLLCSDGFWEYIEEERMEALLQGARSPEEWLRRMDAETIQNGQDEIRDNYSAICVFVSR